MDELQKVLAAAQSELNESRAQVARDAEQLASQEAEVARLNQSVETADAERQQQTAAASAAAANAARLQELKKLQSAEIMRLLGVLGVAEVKVRGQAQTIRELGSDVAMGAQVSRLGQFRSEFFSQLHAALEQRKDVQIVGDRFVLPAEILFESGSADLEPRGRAELHKVAQALREIGSRIPREVDWVLRIDGHTDRLPIKTAQFDSNWDLASARAIAVVKFLLAEGIDPRWLSANALGEHHPLDSTDDPAAYRRNRRIELKLTQP